MSRRACAPATVHGVLSGGDTLEPWFAGVAAVALTAVALAFGFRARRVLAA